MKLAHMTPSVSSVGLQKLLHRWGKCTRVFTVGVALLGFGGSVFAQEDFGGGEPPVVEEFISDPVELGTQVEVETFEAPPEEIEVTTFEVMEDGGVVVEDVPTDEGTVDGQVVEKEVDSVPIRMNTGGTHPVIIRTMSPLPTERGGGTVPVGEDGQPLPDSNGEEVTLDGEPTDGEETPIDVILEENPWLILYMMAGGVDGEALDPDVIFWTLGAPLPLTADAQTHNQINVAAALDANAAQATGDVATMLQELIGLNSADRRKALDSLSGQSYGTASTVGLQIGDRSMKVVVNRLINNRVFLTDNESSLLGQRSVSPGLLGENSILRAQSPVYGASGWFQGYGSNGEWQSNGNASSADYRLGGFAYGVDLAGDESGVIGISGGHGFTSFDAGPGVDGDVTSHQVGAYLLKNFEQFYFVGAFNYGYNQNKVSRAVTVGGITNRVSSKFRGNQYGTYTEAGTNFDTTYVRFQPFVGLQWLSLTNNSSSEGAGGGVGLTVGGGNVSTLQSHIGLRTMLQPIQHRSGIELRPYLSSRYVADLLGEDTAVSASLNGAPAGTGWSVTGNHAGRHLGVFGPGLNAQITDRFSLFANYDYQFGSRFWSHTGSGGLLFEF